MPCECDFSFSVCVEAVIERDRKRRAERVFLPAALGEHAIIPGESFDVHVLIEACAESSVEVELIALRPYSTIYDGTILRLIAGETTSFTFENMTDGGLREIVRLCVTLNV